MKEHFTQEIIRLKRALAQQTIVAEAALNNALRAAETANVSLADSVVQNDYAIDCEEIRIEEDCLKILALYQPVASDLRTIVTVLKINIEIERVADMASNIAARTKTIAASNVPAEARIDFVPLATVATTMLKDALDAFAYRDPERAQTIIARDDEADDLHRNNIDKIKESIKELPDQTSYYLSCMTISKNLERIADIATNICEDVIYLERGKIVRHGNGE